MVTRAVEVERKYDADEAVRPDLTGLPGVAEVDGPTVHQLDATYYDTADLRLMRAKATLRRRTGGHDAGWHLKLPARQGSGRVELRLPLGRGKGVPKALADLAASRSRGAELGPAANLATTRTEWRLLDEHGRLLAEVVADAVHAQTMGSATTSMRWHEVEVEQAAGPDELLDAIEERVVAQGARPSASRSKIGKVLADRLPPAPEPDGTAGAVVVAALRDHVEQLVAFDPLVRRDEADALHQMRVAARRARSVLQSFREVLDSDETEPVVEELRWLGRVLAETRDAEVQAALLREQLATVPDELVLGPVAARIGSHFHAERATAHRHALTELRSPRHVALLDALARLVDDPPFTEAAAGAAKTVLLPLVGRTQRRVRRAMRRYDRTGADDDLHAVRKAAKRARYAIEAVEPIVGPKAARSAKEIKDVQSLLGDHQDRVVARDVLRLLGLRAHAAGENAFTYGLLLADGEATAQRLREQLPAVWARADGKKARRWMG